MIVWLSICMNVEFKNYENIIALIKDISLDLYYFETNHFVMNSDKKYN